MSVEEDRGSETPMTKEGRRLLRIFAPLLGATSLVGCGEAVTGADLRHDLPDTVCDEDGNIEFVSGVDPAEPFDYLALRSTSSLGPETPEVVEQVGEPCATEECIEILASPIESDFVFGLQALTWVDLAVTRGVQAELLGTETEVLDLLGEVNTPKEAALLAFLRGYRLDCEGNNVRETPDGFVIYGETGSTCGGNVKGHLIGVYADGTVRVLRTAIAEKGDPNCVIGRLPSGLLAKSATRARPVHARREKGHAVGTFYAEVAHLEAAAVHAFDQLSRELVLHQAPASLIRQARAARADEQRHALITGDLALRYGQRAVAPVVMSAPVRDLESIAHENVREGLLRETFGALVGHHQARHATDPVIRRAAQEIARDETRHAALSWELHRWFERRLSRAARRRVNDTFHAELAALRAPFCRPPEPEVQALAGMPSEPRARAYYHGLERRLWRTRTRRDQV